MPASVQPEEELAEEECYAVDVATVSKLVQEAKRQLQPFADATTLFAREKALTGIGRNEGLFSLMRIAELDQDCNGQLSAAEVRRFKELGRAVVDAYLSFFTSDGVVTALVLSILWAVPLDHPVELGWDLKDVTWERTLVFACLGYVFVVFAIALNVMALFYVAGWYHIICFWMPNLTAQLWFCQRIQPHIPQIVACKTYGLLSGAVSLCFYGLAWSGPLGFVGLLPVLAIVFPVVHLFMYLPPMVVNPYLHRQLQRLLGRQTTPSDDSTPSGDAKGAETGGLLPSS